MHEPWRKAYLCRKTVIEMLQDRGYSMNESSKPVDFNDFISIYPNAINDRTCLRILVAHPKTQQQLIVHFFDDVKIGSKALKDLVESFNVQKIDYIMFVVREKISPAALKYIEENKNVEIFREDELQYNVTHHELVPKHRILSFEEKQKLLEDKKIKIIMLPRITRTDVVSRYFGAKLGDVFEILRDSETAGKALYYRVVV